MKESRSVDNRWTLRMRFENRGLKQDVVDIGWARQLSLVDLLSFESWMLPCFHTERSNNAIDAKISGLDPAR